MAGFSQSKKPYITYGGEFIFSSAVIEENGSPESATLRFSPFLNLQMMMNKDLSKHFGLFTGLALRNVGYIISDYQFPPLNHTYKKIFRSYNLGIPVGIKLGNLNKLFFYGGYEVELPTIYKEKTFENGEKIDKIME